MLDTDDLVRACVAAHGRAEKRGAICQVLQPQNPRRKSSNFTGVTLYAETSDGLVILLAASAAYRVERTSFRVGGAPTGVQRLSRCTATSTKNLHTLPVGMTISDHRKLAHGPYSLASEGANP